MSSVTGFVLVCSGSEGMEWAESGPGNLARINAWLGERRFAPIVDLADKYAVGSKHPQLYLFAAGYNYFPEDEFITFFRVLRWNMPECCLLLLQPEEGETRVVRAHADAEHVEPTISATSPYGYGRFEMLLGAWNAADAIVDYKGDLNDDLDRAKTKFLQIERRDGITDTECSNAFLTAVGIAQSAEGFRRSECPQNSPRPSRRYELVLSLARRLEAEFPDADRMFILAACRRLDQHWGY